MPNIVSQISVHQQHELLIKLEAAGLTGKHAQKVIESRDNALAREIVALIRSPSPTYPNYTVSVDYDRTVEELAEDSNCVWVVSGNRSLYFPSNEYGKAQVDIYLVHFDHDISSDDVIKEMNAQGLRPATLKELLALGIDYPDHQCVYPTVALGTVWGNSVDEIYVPTLYRYPTNTRLLGMLSLDWRGADWGSLWRFAAVLK